MEFKFEQFSETRFIRYARIGFVPTFPTNGKLIWHIDCLGHPTGRTVDGEAEYERADYDEFDGAVIVAESELDAVRKLCDVLGNSGCRRRYDWTVKLVGQAIREYEDDVVMMSNVGA